MSIPLILDQKTLFYLKQESANRLRSKNIYVRATYNFNKDKSSGPFNLHKLNFLCIKLVVNDSNCEKVYFS